MVNIFSQPHFILRFFTTTSTPPCPKEELQPQPKALPLARGRDATAPPRRSFTKVPSTHQRVGVIVHAT